MSESDPSLAAIAEQGASAIHAAFVGFQNEFRAITRRARSRFEARDWRANQRDAKERLDLYGEVMESVRLGLRSLLRERASDRPLWRLIKRGYAERITDEPNAELARTFYNSVTRKIFATVGVRPDIEFLSLESGLDAPPAELPGCRRYAFEGSTHQLVRRILDDYRFRPPYEDVERDAERAAQAIERYLATRGPTPIDRVETVDEVFYRHNFAFIVGRLVSGPIIIPLVLPLRHESRGVRVDAVLMTQDDVSILFSFTRAYFHVDAPRPTALIVFLRSIMPLKPVSEIYTALGFHKHGKTELYRELRRYLSQFTDRFRSAEGDRGMVMIVFTLEHFDIVFKVIRDRFDYPKQSTRREVMDRYRMVFKHDRVGRLVDAHEFEHLSFSRALFSDELLDELLRDAGATVSLDGEEVIISHLYTERRVTPLNLYLRQARPPAARRAVIDYGNAIKDLAAANIFPGDFLLKNFGVTRHGRVVFYDYDELCMITDCRFRRLPPPRNPEEELSPEPWFTVADNDIFPEEFERFLGLPPELREVFVSHHAELFDPRFWRGLSERLARGEIMDFVPYPRRRRLSRSS